MISVKDVVLLAAEFVGVKEKVDDYLSGVMDEEHQRLVDGFAVITWWKMNSPSIICPW